MTAPPVASVVIPTRNRAASLDAAVRSIVEPESTTSFGIEDAVGGPSPRPRAVVGRLSSGATGLAARLAGRP